VKDGNAPRFKSRRHIVQLRIRAAEHGLIAQPDPGLLKLEDAGGNAFRLTPGNVSEASARAPKPNSHQNEE